MLWTSVSQAIHKPGCGGELRDWTGTQKYTEVMSVVTIIVINSLDNNHLAAVAMHFKEYSLGVCVCVFNILDGTEGLGF